MARFTMKIAGCTAGITSLFESTPAYFRNYLTEEPPQTQFTVTPEDITFEGDFLYQEALEEGFRVRSFPDPFLERAAIQRKFAEHLFDTGWRSIPVPRQMRPRQIPPPPPVAGGFRQPGCNGQ